MFSKRWLHQNGSINFNRITFIQSLIITIVNPQPMYRVGDLLFIKIVAIDSEGRQKSYGGDFLRTKLYSKYPVQASTSGIVTDYGNGTYISRFLLSWPGHLSLSVKLIHSSEAVQVLKKIREKFLRRLMKCSFLQKGSNVSEWVPCTFNINKSLNLRDVCDFSKPLINVTFHCQRPTSSPCDSLSMCIRDQQRTNKLFKPVFARNNESNTTLHYQFHHFPLNQAKPISVNDLYYVAERIDSIIGGPNVVIILGLWGHYTAEPIETFRSRVYGVRRAIERMHRRYPDTKVIWRTSNVRDHVRFFHFVENSDWYAHELMLEGQKILQGVNISIIDVWDMSESMWHEPIMHPPEDVVENHINMLLSYICPL
ncbi:PREDICTED: NXPE family member 3-like [Branchiostoma belcheri]|uniref:NXPE family member 3-like n=1 Tax=Branchiostoma belcheri TaxID=7741 RepID=A0A6P4XW62_BRABE|nr:PREDICTED: NXPE family member 3-like [Branchiostoma belcheri]